MREGNFLIYSDTAVQTREAFDLDLMKRLSKMMVEDDNGNNGGYNLAVKRFKDSSNFCCPEKRWNKADTYAQYCPGRNQTEDGTGQYCANWMMIKKTPATVEFIKGWVDGVSDYHLVSDEPSTGTSRNPHFKDHRRGQSVFSLAMKCRYNEAGLTHVQQWRKWSDFFALSLLTTVPDERGKT